MMHPFSPFCSPNFAHHFPAHPLENTVPYSLFICQCSGARLLRPSHTSGTKDPCRPFCAFPASVLLEIRTYRLYQSCSPHNRSRTPFHTLFYAFQCSGVRLAHPTNCANIRPLVFCSYFFIFSFASVSAAVSYWSDSRLAHSI